MPPTREQQRLQEHNQERSDWQLWGPYLSARAWSDVLSAIFELMCMGRKSQLPMYSMKAVSPVRPTR